MLLVFWLQGPVICVGLAGLGCMGFKGVQDVELPGYET